MNKIYFWKDFSVQDLHTELKNNDVIISSTDTVAGLLALPALSGFKKLNQLKQKEGKPYLLVAASIDNVKSLVEFEFADSVERLVKYCWPGPLTLIIKAKEEIPNFIKSADGNIAIRIPKHDHLLELLKETGPLFSTSANITNKPVPRFVSEIDPQLLDSVNIALQEKDDKTISIVPSTILDCTKNEIKLVREGAYDLEVLERVSGVKIVRE